MATITLGEIKDSVERKYAPFTIDMGEAGKVELVQALRLDKLKRDAVAEAQKAIGDTEDEDAIRENLEKIIKLAATNEQAAQALIDWANGELVFLVEIVQEYGNSAQTGEASPSGS